MSESPPPSTTPPSAFTPTPELQKKFWRWNLIILTVFLTIWFVVSILLGIVFAEDLNQFKWGGFPVGFWIAQQGSIYTFVLLVLAYALLMRKLDVWVREEIQAK